MRIRAVMQSDVVSFGPNDTARDAYEAMMEGGFRHAPIVEEGQLVGIVTDRDLLLQAVEEDGITVLPDLSLASIMTKTVETCAASSCVSDVADLMIERKIDALSVVDATGRLIGIVTSSDLLGLIAVRDHNRRQRSRPLVYKADQFSNIARQVLRPDYFGEIGA